MSNNNKRKSEGKDRSRRRFRHVCSLVDFARWRSSDHSYQDGTPIQHSLNGPSIWVTCVRGKERQAVGELYDLFEQYAAEMWPGESSAAADAGDEDNSDEDDEDDDIEKQIAKEMSTMKRPRKETRFGRFYATRRDCDLLKRLASLASQRVCRLARLVVSTLSSLPCITSLRGRFAPPVVILTCKPPIDPLKLVIQHVQTVLKTGVTQTKSAFPRASWVLHGSHLGRSPSTGLHNA